MFRIAVISIIICIFLEIFMWLILHYLSSRVCSGRRTTVMEPFCVTSSKSLENKLRATVQHSPVGW